MKRRVLFLIESLSGGGAEKVLVTLLQYLDYSKFDVTLCCMVNRGEYQQNLPKEVNYKYILPDCSNFRGLRLALYRIKYRLIYNWLPLSWVYQLFVPHHADVEVAFVEGFASKLLAHSTNALAKKIAWVHCDMNRHHWTDGLYARGEEEKCYQSYQEIVTVSETAKASFIRLFASVEASIVKTIHNPIDASAIRVQSDKNLDERHHFRLISVGRLTPVKAFDRLLRIISRLRLRFPNIELWLLGEGGERKYLENYIAENGLEPNVKLLGFQSNPYQYMAQSDLFVCSSISEGYSTAVTEALILGLPVVTTDCSGMHELLDKGPCGVITENNEEALYDGLYEVLSNPQLLSELAEKANERSDDFSIESLMKPIEDLLLS